MIGRNRQHKRLAKRAERPAGALGTGWDEQAVCRAADPSTTAAQDVGVDHGGADVAVPEELLDRPDVIAVLEQMRSERVPQTVTRRPLGNSGPP